MELFNCDCYYEIFKYFNVNELISYAIINKENYLLIQKVIGKLHLTIKPKSNEQLIIFCNIRNLNLGWNEKITDEGIKNLINLKDLNLWRNEKITDEGIKNLINLKNLNLWRNEQITDEGIKNLINCKILR